MTWYFNNDGIADGPHDEVTLHAMVKKGRISANTLVWNAGSSQQEWLEVETLAPDWWKGSPPKGAGQERAPGPGEKPSVGPETRGLTPKAPGAGIGPTGGGFFSKLFGWGKKK